MAVSEIDRLVSRLSELLEEVLGMPATGRRDAGAPRQALFQARWCPEAT